MTAAIDTYAAGTRQLVEDAQRLGISWTLRPGTVIITDPLKVTFDGDDAPITAVSLIGILSENTRVMGLIIPPGGNFIVGFNSPQFTDRLSAPVNLNQVSVVGSTTSATYVNFPNLPFVSVNKRFNSTFTNIWVDVGISMFSSAINTSASVALNLTGGTGTDVEVMQIFLNLATTHTYASFSKLLTGLAPGIYTLSARWRRATGAGTLQTDGSDWVSITAEEVWAI